MFATEDNTSLAYGWYADTEFLEHSSDRMSGIRVRLGNILIEMLKHYLRTSKNLGLMGGF
jgi:hypothetical protein